MTKLEAIHAFFAGFDLPAYEESDAPAWSDDAQTAENKPPYITYHCALSEFRGDPVSVICNVWDLSESWEFVDNKADEIAKTIGRFCKLSCDDGIIVITKGSPFAQPYADGPYKRMYMNLMLHFITN